MGARRAKVDSVEPQAQTGEPVAKATESPVAEPPAETAPAPSAKESEVVAQSAAESEAITQPVTETQPAKPAKESEDEQTKKIDTGIEAIDSSDMDVAELG